MGHEVIDITPSSALEQYRAIQDIRLGKLMESLKVNLWATENPQLLKNYFTNAGMNDLLMRHPIPTTEIESFETVEDFANGMGTFGNIFDILKDPYDAGIIEELVENDNNTSVIRNKLKRSGVLGIMAGRRYLQVDPGGLKNLVGQMSSGKSLETMVPELFVAYNTMARLVDQFDDQRVAPRSVVNARYLLES